MCINIKACCIEVPIEEASKGSIKLELNPVATQLPIQGLSIVPASNFIFFSLTLNTVNITFLYIYFCNFIII